jgi:hypothetical protein
VDGGEKGETEEVPTKLQSFPTCSLIFIRFFARDLLFALKMDSVSTSETSANLHDTTRRVIPEDTHLHTRCRENLKTHVSINVQSKFFDFF